MSIYYAPLDSAPNLFNKSCNLFDFFYRLPSLEMDSLLELLQTYFGPGYYHIIIEAGLVLCLVSLFKTRPKRPKSTIVLTTKERQQLIGSYTVMFYIKVKVLC